MFFGRSLVCCGVDSSPVVLSSIPSLVSIALLLKSYNQIIYTPILMEESEVESILSEGSVSISVPVEETQVKETQLTSTPSTSTSLNSTQLISTHPAQTPGKTHSLLTCFLSTGITWLLYDFNVRREAPHDA